jgi:hypothetical protein
MMISDGASDYAVSLDCFDRGTPGVPCSVFLPLRSRLGTFEHQQRQPTDEWPATFLCLRHGRSLIRSVDDIHLDAEMLDPHQPASPAWRIECECGHRNCGRLHTIYIGRMPDWPTIVLRILRTNPCIVCGSHDLIWQKVLMHGFPTTHDLSSTLLLSADGHTLVGSQRTVLPTPQRRGFLSWR